MFVTCHITFGQPSNFVGASLEVTRTIRNNKLHFTWGCSILLLKKGKGLWERIPFFFQWFWHFLKYFDSNHNLPSYSLLSNVVCGFSILVCIGVQVFCVLFFFSLLLSRLLRACLRLTEKRWKITPVLQIQASSMKLRVHGFFFLVFLHIKTNGQNKLFLGM